MGVFRRNIRRKPFRAKGRKPGRKQTAFRKRSRPTIQRVARQLQSLSRTIETKSGVQTFPDGIEIAHNTFVTFSSALLSTFNGTEDKEDGSGRRIGDKITIKALQIKGMVELNERYSDVGVKVIVVKSAKGDTPTPANLWQGASGNKLLDTFNTERYTILKSKFIKMKAPNMSIIAAGVQTVGSGFTANNTQTQQQSRATKMFSGSIPGSKFGKGGVIQYENGSPQTKFFDYHLLFFAYSNFSTSATLGFNVARVNDAFAKMHYKDA